MSEKINSLEELENLMQGVLDNKVSALELKRAATYALLSLAHTLNVSVFEADEVDDEDETDEEQE